jgi:hypothetical protein
MTGWIGLSLRVALLLALVAVPANAQSHDGEVVEVPLREHGGRLIVPVRAADGTGLEFILSTGVGVTVFSESGAARAGGLGGLTLGGLAVPSEGSQTLPDQSLETDGTVFDGMIGPNMLADFDILIDLPRERLLLRPAGSAGEWEGVELSDPVRLRVFHGIVLSLDVELNGQEYPATLEIGTPAVIVNTRASQEAGLQSTDVATITLGGAAHPDLPVEVRELEIFERWSPNGDGFVLVGAPITYGCAVSISWVRREMRTCRR